MDGRHITSKKRKAIYDLLCADTGHPAAETVYNRLKADYPEISLGTVYRNLAVLEEEGLVFRVGTVDGQERYDARLDPHAHFVCSRCHRVSDIELDEDTEKLLADIERRFDCSAQSFLLTIKGLCGECRKKLPDREK